GRCHPYRPCRRDEHRSAGRRCSRAAVRAASWREGHATAGGSPGLPARHAPAPRDPHRAVSPRGGIARVLEPRLAPVGGRGRAGGNRRGLLRRRPPAQADGQSGGPAVSVAGAVVTLLALLVAPYTPAAPQRERATLRFDRAWRFHLGH